MQNQNTTGDSLIINEQQAPTLHKKIKGLLSLSFKDRELEKAFRADYFQKSLTRVRLSILFAVFLYGMFGLLDEYIIFEVRQQAWIIRYAIFCPLTIAVFLLSYLKTFQRLLEPSLVILGFIAGAGITMMIALADPPGSDLYYAGLLLCSMFYFIFLGLRFPYASGLSWAVFVVYEITAVWIKGMPTPILINNSFFFVAFNITGMWACYSIERYVRSDFLQNRTILEQADKLRMIFENSPVGILHFNQEGKITDCNPSLSAIMGSSPEKIIGLNIITGLNDDRVSTAVKQVLTGRAADGEGEYVSVTARKTVLAKVHFAPIIAQDGTVVGGVGIIEDVTERKKAEEALRASEQKYRYLVENANDIIYATDVNGYFTVVNRACVQVSGYSEEEIIGKHYLDPIPSEYREEAAQVYNSQFANRIPYTYHEFPFLTKHGEIRWLGQNTHLVAEGETVLGFQSISRDITELKKAQVALQANETMLKVILSTSPVGIALTCDRIVNWANEAWMMMFGFDSEQEFIGKSTRMLYPSEEEYKRAGNVLFKDIQADRVNVADVTFCRKDRSVFDGYVRSRAIDPQNPSEGSISAVSDVSERKKAERALLISENRLELALQGADLGWWDRDLETDKVVRNERWAQMLGYSQDEIDPKGVFWEKLVHPEDFPRVKQAFDEHLLGVSTSYESEYRLQTKEGGWKWVLDRGKIVERDVTGRPKRVTGTLLDIDKRKKSELVQRRLATAIEQAAEGVVITDAEGNVEYVNPAFEKITGYTLEEFIGRKPSLLAGGEYGPDYLDNLQNLLSTGSSWTGSLNKKRKDGTPYQEDTTISPVLDESGKIINYVALKRDVSHEVLLQKQLLQAQKMEAVGNLAGGIAHDFNNLLQIVLGYSEALLQSRKEGETDYANIQKIQQAGKRGADLVKSLLMFSRKVEPAYQFVSLNQEILQVHDLLSRTIPKTIKIDLHLGGDLESVQVDPSQLSQILMNLGVNARDAMPEGGTLTIETSNIELDKECCSDHLGVKSGRYVLLTVSDTGQGMDSETLSHIFEPFFTTKEVGKGTGLGLASVYGIVKQHGGNIMCYSEVGHGTTFKIYFPSIQTEGRSETPALETDVPVGTETILLVEDDDVVRELCQELLSGFGYEVIVAVNGKEALEIYHRDGKKISLVILDLIMPEMDGWQCLAKILRVDPKAKVIIASGYIDSGIAKGMQAKGATGFVQKPFEMSQLLTTIREVLDKDNSGPITL